LLAFVASVPAALSTASKDVCNLLCISRLQWRRFAFDRRRESFPAADDREAGTKLEYGHIAGDKCLKTAAAAIRNVARRSSGVVARYGGEEFAVILTVAGETIAAVLAERMRGKAAELGLSIEASDVSSVVTVSIGVATVTFNGVASSPEGNSPKAIADSVRESTLVALANDALYSAKSTGRNKIVRVVREISELAARIGAEVTHNKPSDDSSSR
jgi:diguanylate cyclase (GGDEF)-like protein